MLSYTIQNFYYKETYLLKTLRNKYLIMLKNANTFNFLTKFILFIPLQPYNSIISFRFIKNFLNDKIRDHHFNFYKKIKDEKVGVWTTNLVKSTINYNIRLAMNVSRGKNPKIYNQYTTKSSSLELPLSYFKHFELLIFNLNKKIYKTNIFLIIHWFLNSNTAHTNYFNVIQTFIIYPHYFNFIHCNDYYYFKIKRF